MIIVSMVTVVYTFFMAGSDLLIASSLGLVMNWWKDDDTDV